MFKNILQMLFSVKHQISVFEMVQTLFLKASSVFDTVSTTVVNNSYLLEQETLLSLLSTGWFQETDSSVIYISKK